MYYILAMFLYSEEYWLGPQVGSLLTAEFIGRDINTKLTGELAVLVSALPGRAY